MRSIILILLGILAVCSILFSLIKGSTLITYYQLFAAFSGHSSPLIHQIIFELRLPRTLAAFVTGGLLGMAGALMQVLVRNPLADPYVLGISGGAAIGALLCILAGLSGFWLTSGAWVGSLVAIVLVLSLSQFRQRWSTSQFLLTGVALASGFAALISFILLMGSDLQLRSMLFWLLGDLSYAHLPSFEIIVLLVGLFYALYLAKELNLLARGDFEAKALGVNTSRLQIVIYLLCSLFTATAVTLAGCIGFVGLIVPHLFRLLCGYDHRYLLPGCVLLGGSLLTIADTLSRVVLAPQQLPVGIMMALLGIPLFLLLLRRSY